MIFFLSWALSWPPLLRSPGETARSVKITKLPTGAATSFPPTALLFIKSFRSLGLFSTAFFFLH